MRNLKLCLVMQFLKYGTYYFCLLDIVTLSHSLKLILRVTTLAWFVMMFMIFESHFMYLTFHLTASWLVYNYLFNYICLF